MFAQTGHYHGVVVRIKELKFSKKKDISRDVMKEMRTLREIRHSNLNSFIGACVEPMRILLIADYCAKGSLYVRHSVIMLISCYYFLVLCTNAHYVCARAMYNYIYIVVA